MEVSQTRFSRIWKKNLSKPVDVEEKKNKKVARSVSDCNCSDSTFEGKINQIINLLEGLKKD